MLLYSDQKLAIRAQSEFTLLLRTGLKTVLKRLGRVPRELLSDHSLTVTHQLGRSSLGRGFNEDYLSIWAHFGITSHTIKVSSLQENASFETSHGHLKYRIKQHFLLRESSDFVNQAEYGAFLFRVLEACNLKLAKRLGEELVAMPETLVADLADYRELMVSVRNDSTIWANKMIYLMPCN